MKKSNFPDGFRESNEFVMDTNEGEMSTKVRGHVLPGPKRIGFIITPHNRISCRGFSTLSRPVRIFIPPLLVSFSMKFPYVLPHLKQKG